MRPVADSARRLFGIVGARDRHLVNLCSGPDADGECPRAVSGAIPCAGERVVPLRGTGANGLVFSVRHDQRGPRCPLAWIDNPPGQPPGEAPEASHI